MQGRIAELLRQAHQLDEVAGVVAIRREGEAPDAAVGEDAVSVVDEQEVRRAVVRDEEVRVPVAVESPGLSGKISNR